MLYDTACQRGVSPLEFWNLTLREVRILIKQEEVRDRLTWNHTASLMSIYANSKSAKGKSYTPSDFNPYDNLDKESAKPKTKKDVLDLVEKMKSFNGKK